MFRKKEVFPLQRRIPFSFLLFAFLLNAVSAFSQTLHFRQYSVDEGLPFVQVFTIFQDSKGYLWTGGYGGLSRFDGISFENYSPRNGLPNHYVTSITEDSRGDLWVGTIEGVARYQNGQFQNFTEKDGLPDHFVNCLLKDERNLLWIGTSKGLCRYDGKQFSVFGKDGPGSSSILCFYQEPNTSRIWIGTSDGVFLYDNGTFTHYPVSAFFDSKVTAITRNRDGKILAGSADGLFVFDRGRFNLLITPEGFEMPSVSSMVSDRDGIVWIAAENGLFSYDGKDFRHYRVSLNANAGNVISLFNDYEGSLWLGTHAGLFRFRGEGFVSFGVHDGLSDNFVFGITRDHSGTLWVCTEKHGVYHYDGSSFVSIGKEEGLADSKTNDCREMPNGELFVGTNNGLSVISNKHVVRTFHRKDGLNSDSVNCLLVDHKGRLWTGGGKGISVYENGKFTAYQMKSNPDDAYDVWTIFEDRKGIIWIGTYLGGLYSFDGNSFTNAGEKLGIDADSYFSICEDKDGRLYFGTLDGLFISDGKTIDRVTESDGLNSDLIYCMVMDAPKEYLWIGTNQGLTRFNLKEYSKNKSKILNIFGKEEGFAGVETNSNGAFLDKNGDLWFGTVNGLIRYSPKVFRLNDAYTKTNIIGIKLFYNDTSLTSGTTLSYFENNISFEFVGICLTSPKRVRYKFMLAGFDPDWSPMTSERIARYSNLPPGTYTFKVLSTNNEGLLNPTPAEFKFTISTPFWKRPWFWLLLTGVSILILSLAIIFRIRQIKHREKIESESKVAMARNELKALRAQMNPHFVFNSLNSIQHFILTNKSADAGKYLNKFARLMRVILNNSEKSLITLREEIEYLQLYLELEEMRFENKFSWKISVADNVDIDYYEIPAMLLQPYVENAILHGLTPKKEKGHLEISLSLQKNTLICSIADDGIGREKARELRQLSRRKDHQSLGMKITHDRLELINRLHGSNLSLTITDLHQPDESPAGTRVDIFIPVS